MQEMKAKIRGFLSKFFRTEDWSDDDNIFELGLVNSLIALQLVLFVEKEFALQVEDDDLDLRNFSTVNAIADLVGRKTRAVEHSFAADNAQT